MDLFSILQMFFDAVFLFWVLFLFHYTVHHSEKKKEESEILKNVQVQEMKENLQELLLTLKQLGKEVSDNIQEQVKEAEEKTELFKKILQKLQKDLSKTVRLAEEVGAEKNRLEEKFSVIQTAKSKASPALNPAEDHPLKSMEKMSLDFKDGSENGTKLGRVPKRSGRVGAVGFSSSLVREVYRLVDSEMDINEIIRRTKLSRAEVQLILNLRDNRFTTPN